MDPESSLRCVRVTSPQDPLLPLAAVHIAGLGRGPSDAPPRGTTEAIEALTGYVAAGATVTLKIGHDHSIVGAGIERENPTENHEATVVRFSGGTH